MCSEAGAEEMWSSMTKSNRVKLLYFFVVVGSGGVEDVVAVEFICSTVALLTGGAVKERERKN